MIENLHVIFSLQADESNSSKTLYALHSQEIWQVVDLLECIPVPLAPSCVHGIMAYRGSVVTLLDMISTIVYGRYASDKKPRPLHHFKQVLMLQPRDTVRAYMGLLIDRVVDVVSLPPVATDNQSDKTFGKRVVTWQQQLLHVLDLPYCLSQMGVVLA